MLFSPTSRGTLRLLTIAALLVGSATSASAAGHTPPPAAAHPDLSGIWEPISGGLKPHGHPAFTERAKAAMDPQLTPGQAVWAKNGIDESDANCLPRRQPWMLIQSAPITIVHDGNKMILLYEKRSAPMHVYIADGKSPVPPAPAEPTLNGHAVGHWEGGDLVVESTGFADHPGHGPLNSLPYTPTLKLTERFHLDKGGQLLHATFTVDDPQLFTTPYIYDFTWHRLPYASNFALVELCDARDSARLKY